jgi:hypothetical protein
MIAGTMDRAGMKTRVPISSAGDLRSGRFAAIDDLLKKKQQRSPPFRIGGLPARGMFLGNLSQTGAGN